MIRALLLAIALAKNPPCENRYPECQNEGVDHAPNRFQKNSTQPSSEVPDTPEMSMILICGLLLLVPVAVVWAASQDRDPRYPEE